MLSADGRHRERTAGSRPAACPAVPGAGQGAATGFDTASTACDTSAGGQHPRSTPACAGAGPARAGLPPPRACPAYRARRREGQRAPHCPDRTALHHTTHPRAEARTPRLCHAPTGDVRTPRLGSVSGGVTAPTGDAPTPRCTDTPSCLCYRERSLTPRCVRAPTPRRVRAPRLMHPHPSVFMHPRLIHARPTIGTRVAMLTGPVRAQERGGRGGRRRDPRSALTWLRAVRLHRSPAGPAEGRWPPPPLPAPRPAGRCRAASVHPHSPLAVSMATVSNAAAHWPAAQHALAGRHLCVGQGARHSGRGCRGAAPSPCRHLCEGQQWARPLQSVHLCVGHWRQPPRRGCTGGEDTVASPNERFEARKIPT